jgi:tRNA 2-thiouridine synthesizing protein A
LLWNLRIDYHCADASTKPGTRRKLGRDMADKTVDAKGANCPIPILKAKKAIAEVPVGGTLEVLATDPGSVPDFEAFCRQTGNTLVEHSEAGGVYRFLIKRAG